MPFVKGQARPPNAGKKKGIPNKLAREVAAKLEELKCDPIEGMVRLARDKNNTPELRGKMYAELAQYVYPKRKSVEHSGPGGAPIELNVSGTELLARRIDSLATRIGTGTDPQRAN